MVRRPAGVRWVSPLATPVGAQGLRPEGLRPEGLRPEGLRPEGLRPQGLRPGGVRSPVPGHLRWVETGPFELHLGDRVAVREHDGEWLGEVVVPPERLVEWTEQTELPVV